MACSSRIFLGGVAAVAALVIAAPVAAAHDDVRISPNPAVPGQELDVRVDCDPGPEPPGHAASPVTTHARLNPAADGGLFAEVKVNKDAKPGEYKMTVRCGMMVFSESFTVIDPASVKENTSPLSQITAGIVAALAVFVTGFGWLRSWTARRPKVYRV